MPDPVSDSWDPAFPPVPLAAGETVVWRIPLGLTAAEAAAAEAVLLPDELDRAARFFRAADRLAFVAQRAALRILLQFQLGRSARDIRFSRGERGKPAVADPPGAPEFNASGSGGWGLLAFSLHVALGVDVERHRELEHLDLARQFFSAGEAAELAGLPPERQSRAFFAGWTRKEAFIKALGQGLYYPLDQFTVSVDPDRPARLLSVEGRAERASEWTLCDLAVAPGYSAAVVARGPLGRLRLRHFPGFAALRP